jgi:LacI family transcriptional regulator, galactose operon repressor
VSNVLQGKEHVEEATRARVLEAIAELGYRPNVAARYLRQRSQVLGVVVGDLRNPFHAEIAALIEQYAGEQQHTIVLVTTNGSAATEAARVQALIEHRVAAILFIAFSGDRSVLEMIPPDTRRLFVSFRGPRATAISVDGRKGAQLAVEHLLSLGHRRIAYISTTLAQESHNDKARVSGYRRTLERQGVPVDEDLVLRVTGSPGEGAEAVERRLRELLLSRRRPTAIFAASDFTALEVMEAADSAGIEIPEELSVVGFDDIAIAHLSRVSLTTVAQPMAELAERAVTAAVSGPDDGDARSILLPPRLVVRGSTGPAPRGRARR